MSRMCFKIFDHSEAALFRKNLNPSDASLKFSSLVYQCQLCNCIKSNKSRLQKVRGPGPPAPNMHTSLI
ncbi:hypothetical protein MTR_8g089965 [Medicago truncatula]|uniref:Uncharacterized protein n=1 Tax=Medicago truncatula TaxID=3880 RepID=A0A072TTM7_MEDTR|nr:hypothetical protein MTR_8g089965 [Medicago truncatula]